MRELDVMLAHFIEHHYDSLNDRELDTFDQLLTATDLDLLAWFCGRRQPRDAALSEIVERIRERATAPSNMSSLIEHLTMHSTAAYEHDTVVDFGLPSSEYALLQSQTCKCPLLSYGVVSLAGSDTSDFINGQFSSDCSVISPTRSQLSAWCDAKGRVLFVFVLASDGTDYFALIPKSAIAHFIKRLRMYVLRAAVDITDHSHAITTIGIGAHTSPPGLDFKLPDEIWQTHWLGENDGVISIGNARYLYLLKHELAASRWASIDATPIGERAWHADTMRLGLPTMSPHISGTYLPQELNLDALGAVSFDKGCYPGQEIVARLKYRGKVKKRLRAALGSSEQAVAPKTRIYAPNTDKEIGRIVDAQAVGDSEWILSAMIDTSHPTSEIVLGERSDKFTLIELPYHLPT